MERRGDGLNDTAVVDCLESCVEEERMASSLAPDDALRLR